MIRSKLEFIISNLIFFPILIFFFSSCTESPTTFNPHEPGLGYQESESKVCMTMASLSYVNENNPSYLKDSLIIQLADTSYETKGNWKLAWGPGVDAITGNMMFVAKDTTSIPFQYIIAVRGTDWCFPVNWVEDIVNWKFERFAFGSVHDSVALGTWLGLLAVLNLQDPVSGNLFQYLNSLPSESNVYITGHSLGGALATALTAWFMDSGFTDKFKMKSYTFAAPSIGNASFVKTFNSRIRLTHSESHRIVNPKDIVPKFWANITDIIVNKIPVAPPTFIEAVLIGIEAYLLDENIRYYNVGILQNLRTITTNNCNFPNKSLEQFKCWVGFEHDHNTYLTLLGAPKVNISYIPCDW